ncbi:MAG: hypothetical protein ABJE47_12760 [bacterium]
MSSSASAESPQAILDDTLVLLRAFLTSAGPYVISGEAMAVIVDEFSRRLTAASANGDALRLLRTWYRNMPAVMVRLFDEAGRTELPDGQPVTLLTERDARRLVEWCPDRPEFD